MVLEHLNAFCADLNVFNSFSFQIILSDVSFPATMSSKSDRYTA